MILQDAEKVIAAMGGRKIRNRELKDTHGPYAYTMFVEEDPIFDKTFIIPKQNFLMAGGFAEGGKVVLQKALFTTADILDAPIIIVIFGYMDGHRVFMYHPDEVLTKHRNNTKSLFGVIGIEFNVNIGERLNDLKGLNEKWIEKKIDWIERKKNYHNKTIQRGLGRYLE